jgi:tRNA threonylcarbamoyladenosine biosynthesis protein TsaE
MKNIGEVFDIGMEEYLDNAFLCIIEWPEVYEQELQDFPHHELIIENSGTEREIIFK